MTTMTMPTTIERAQPKPTREVGHIQPFLLAMLLLAMTAVAAMLISGPMH